MFTSFLSCRRLVVASSSARRRQLVNSLPYGKASGGVFGCFLSRVKLKEVSHEMLVLALQTLKVGGNFRVLPGRRNTFPEHRLLILIKFLSLLIPGFFNKIY